MTMRHTHSRAYFVVVEELGVLALTFFLEPGGIYKASSDNFVTLATSVGRCIRNKFSVSERMQCGRILWVHFFTCKQIAE